MSLFYYYKNYFYCIYICKAPSTTVSIKMGEISEEETIVIPTITHSPTQIKQEYTEFLKKGNEKNYIKTSLFF